MHWDLTGIIIAVMLLITGYSIGYRRGRALPRVDRAAQQHNDISDEAIRTQLRAGRKVEAIRLYRQRSGAGLKDARTAVEAIDDGMGHVRTVG